MTRRERAQVVELLRCAADGAPHIGLNGMFDACTGHRDDVIDLAWSAVLGVADCHEQDFVASVYPVDERYRAHLLEAAARVEEGTWP